MTKTYTSVLRMHQLPKSYTLGQGMRYIPCNKCSGHIFCVKLGQGAVPFLLDHTLNMSFGPELSLLLRPAARSNIDLTAITLQYMADKQHQVLFPFIPSFMGLCGVKRCNLFVIALFMSLAYLCRRHAPRAATPGYLILTISLYFIVKDNKV